MPDEDVQLAETLVTVGAGIYADADSDFADYGSSDFADQTSELDSGLENQTSEVDCGLEDPISEVDSDFADYGVSASDLL